LNIRNTFFQHKDAQIYLLSQGFTLNHWLHNMQLEDLKFNFRCQSLPRPGDRNRSPFGSIAY
jgi:hypothetical protein